ncbi:MAG TPA: mycoredoxin [Mycobacteriales bacterium]
MYTTPWCGYCQRLKGQMKRAGIEFAEIDIDADADAEAFVKSTNGGDATVPTLKFADGSTATNPSIKQVQDKLAALA